MTHRINYTQIKLNYQLYLDNFYTKIVNKHSLQTIYFLRYRSNLNLQHTNLGVKFKQYVYK